MESYLTNMSQLSTLMETPPTTRLNKNDFDKMMDKFNKLNEIYNSNLQKSLHNSSSDLKFEILDSEDAEIMYFLDKANKELSVNKKNMENIDVKLKKYEDFLENVNNLNKSIEATKKIYNNLLSKSNDIEISNKTMFMNNTFRAEKDLSIETLKEEINYKIQDLKEEYAKNMNSVVRFRKLLMKTSPQEIKINICSVCATNKINICINPCGHVFCLSCTDKMNNCGMCRGTISSKIKVYLDDIDEDNISENNIESFSGFYGDGIITNAVNV